MTSPIPEGITPIVGWRAWAVKGGRLEALFHACTWPAGEALEAGCENRKLLFLGAARCPPPHPSPEERCTCGIHMARDQRQAMDYARGSYRADVIGTVAMWGKVIVCSRGYRGEFAYPLELWVLPGVRRIFSTRDLSLDYRVPVYRCRLF